MGSSPTPGTFRDSAVTNCVVSGDGLHDFIGEVFDKDSIMFCLQRFCSLSGDRSFRVHFLPQIVIL